MGCVRGRHPARIRERGLKVGAASYGAAILTRRPAADPRNPVSRTVHREILGGGWHGISSDS